MCKLTCTSAGTCFECMVLPPIQVVHSRACTLGNRLSGPHHGSWLVPLFDMLNHAGKETAFLLSGASEAESNTRYGASAVCLCLVPRQGVAS